MLQRAILAVTFAFLLVLGQQGAAVHAISHLAEAESQQQDQAPHSPACDECVVYAGLASGMASAEFHFAAPPQAFVPYPQLRVVSTCAARSPYAARAPPLLA